MQLYAITASLDTTNEDSDVEEVEKAKAFGVWYLMKAIGIRSTLSTSDHLPRLAKLKTAKSRVLTEIDFDDAIEKNGSVKVNGYNVRAFESLDEYKNFNVRKENAYDARLHGGRSNIPKRLPKRVLRM